MIIIKERESKNVCCIYFDGEVELYIEYERLFYKLRSRNYDKIIGNYKIYKLNYIHMTTNFTDEESELLWKRMLPVYGWYSSSSLKYWISRYIEYLGDFYDVEYRGVC